MINVHRLQALVAVAQTGTVTAAAEELHYSQSTLTHHLQRLEVETGAVLLQRVGRSVRLTPEGRLLVDHGREIIGRLARAQMELDALTSLQAGRVRLAVFPSAANTLIPDLLSRVAHEAPGVRIDLVEAEPPEATELVRTSEVDAALAFSYDPTYTSERFMVTPLFSDPLFLIVARDDPRSNLAEHCASRWLTGCERCRGELMTICADAGFAPDIGMATDDYLTVQTLVATGFGVSILPGLALASHTDARVRRVALPGRARHVHLLTYGEAPLPAGLGLVTRLLTENAARARAHCVEPATTPKHPREA